MKASDAFIKVLENEGVAYIFGVAGEENLHLLESIRKSTIQFIPTRHEQAAGFMAATIGRLTGQPGVCLSTLGPGATNLVTAVAYAQLGGMPALFITGQKPIKKSKQGNFQIIHTVEMMKPLTKFTKQIIQADTIPSIVYEAMRVAKEERPGAVHIELPEDIAYEEIESPVFLPVNRTRRPVAEDKAITQAVELIKKSQRPLVLVGAGANRKRISNTLTAFIEKTGIPFFTTQMGKGVIDERHSQYLGTAALSQGDYIHCCVAQADLIINVGHDTIEKPPFIMQPGSTSQQVIHINFSPAIVDQIYFPQIEVIGDIANTLWKMSELLTPQSHWDFSYEMKVKEKLLEHFRSMDAREHYPYTPHQVVRAVRKCLRDEDLVTLDNGMYKIWFARDFPAFKENTLLLDNALATMGAGLPSAISAKLTFPQKKVTCVCGDGGFMMNSQEIETAIRLNLDLVVLILNDNGYGMIKWKQDAMNLPNFGLEFRNPDFVKYAQSYGANGYKVEKLGDLESLLQQCIQKKGIHIIDVPIDYSDNKEILIKELSKKICEI